MRHSSALLFAGVFCAAASAHAHHGRDFLLLQDYAIPTPFHGVVTGGFEWASQKGDDAIELEAGAFTGLAPRLGFGVNLKGGDHGDGWNVSAVAPYLQVQLTPPASSFPVRVAFLAGYEFAVTRDAHGHGHDHGAHEHKATPKPRRKASSSKLRPAAAAAAPPSVAVTAAPCGPDYGPDAPPCDDPAAPPAHDHSTHDHGSSDHGGEDHAHDDDGSAGHAGHDHELSDATTADDLFHGHAGIHRHGENHFFGRLIIESDLTSADKVLVNVIAVVPERGRSAWGYAAGYRHAFSHAVALGVEAIGDFGEGDSHEILAAAYLEPMAGWLVRLGAGFGLSDNAPDFSLRAGVVWRF